MPFPLLWPFFWLEFRLRGDYLTWMRKVSPREVRIIGVFMALCHALVEDTAIFLAVGVPLFFLLVPRLAAAYLCCWGLHRFMVWRERREFQGKAVNG